MTNDELVKRLRECTAEQNGEKTLWHEAADAIEELTKDFERSKEWEKFWEKEANEALKKFQTTVAKIPHWIPVTERLPFAESGNASQEVLVTDGQNMAIAVWFNFEMFEPYWSYTGTGEITHWMPLPQPPKESEP